MRVPDALLPLLEQGIIHDVLRPLMSGKEADVYLVEAEGEVCVAKTYKQAEHRSFKHRSDYLEGRKGRNTRSQRAIAKRSKFGRSELEDAWRTAEVDVIYKLSAAGVRVPEPYAFSDGVLVMELVQGEDGEPAPRLVDAQFTEDEAWDLFHVLLTEVVKMLCAGVVHGDLSDFNVLLAWNGPVIIDFPQATDPAHNRNARRLLIRDVNNLTSFLARHTPALRKKQYGEEMWALYEAGNLRPDTKLTGRRPKPSKLADTASLLDEIEAIARENDRKREALGLKPRRTARAPKPAKRTPVPADQRKKGPKNSSQDRPKNRPDDRPKKKRRRRKKKPAASKAPALDFDTSDDLDAFLS